MARKKNSLVSNNTKKRKRSNNNEEQLVKRKKTEDVTAIVNGQDVEGEKADDRNSGNKPNSVLKNGMSGVELNEGNDTSSNQQTEPMGIIKTVNITESSKADTSDSVIDGNASESSLKDKIDYARQKYGKIFDIAGKAPYVEVKTDGVAGSKQMDDGSVRLYLGDIETPSGGYKSLSDHIQQQQGGSAPLSGKQDPIEQPFTSSLDKRKQRGHVTSLFRNLGYDITSSKQRELENLLVSDKSFTESNMKERMGATKSTKKIDGKAQTLFNQDLMTKSFQKTMDTYWDIFQTKPGQEKPANIEDYFKGGFNLGGWISTLTKNAKKYLSSNYDKYGINYRKTRDVGKWMLNDLPGFKDVLDQLTYTSRQNEGIVENMNRDKVVITDEDESDLMTQRGSSLKDVSARNVIRVKEMELAGSGPLQTSPQEAAKNNDLFEAYSFVSPGYSLGPYNSLARLNDQHNFYRYGMNPMFLPRPAYWSNMPHKLPAQWYESVDSSQVISDMAMKNLKDQVSGHAVQRQLNAPMQFLDYDYNMTPSSQFLPRRKPALTQPVINTIRHYLPTFDTSGSKISNENQFRKIFKGTWNYPNMDAGMGSGFN